MTLNSVYYVAVKRVYIGFKSFSVLSMLFVRILNIVLN